MEGSKGVNKRKYYRINFDVPLCSEVSIKAIHGKEIETGVSSICVMDIGPGGLSFLTNLKFPVDENIVYKFRIKLLDFTLCVIGVIVRSLVLRNGSTSYGVKFILSDIEEPRLIQIFNKLSLVLRKDPRHSGCKFCKRSVYPCNGESSR